MIDLLNSVFPSKRQSPVSKSQSAIYGTFYDKQIIFLTYFTQMIFQKESQKIHPLQAVNFFGIDRITCSLKFLEEF